MITETYFYAIQYDIDKLKKRELQETSLPPHPWPGGLGCSAGCSSPRLPSRWPLR
jgi:hypothetical protein